MVSRTGTIAYFRINNLHWYHYTITCFLFFVVWQEFPRMLGWAAALTLIIAGARTRLIPPAPWWPVGEWRDCPHTHRSQPPTPPLPAHRPRQPIRTQKLQQERPISKQSPPHQQPISVHPIRVIRSPLLRPIRMVGSAWTVELYEAAFYQKTKLKCNEPCEWFLVFLNYLFKFCVSTLSSVECFLFFLSFFFICAILVLSQPALSKNGSNIII